MLDGITTDREAGEMLTYMAFLENGGMGPEEVDRLPDEFVDKCKIMWKAREDKT